MYRPGRAHEPSGTCTHFGQDWLCDDGAVCNGLEQCGASGCQAGPASAALYWEIKADDDRWLGGEDLARLAWARYAEAGLLPLVPA